MSEFLGMDGGREDPTNYLDDYNEDQYKSRPTEHSPWKELDKTVENRLKNIDRVLVELGSNANDLNNRLRVVELKLDMIEREFSEPKINFDNPIVENLRKEVSNFSLFPQINSEYRGFEVNRNTFDDLCRNSLESVSREAIEIALDEADYEEDHENDGVYTYEY